MSKHLLRFAILVSVAISSFLTVAAQTGTYAITGAEIHTVSGAVISNGTVVVRDGLIESVGASVKVPADAKVIDGKGLSVYPGFFDTNTELGLPAPGPAQGGGNASQQSNSNYPASLRPDQTATERLKAGEAQFASYRNEGITTAVTNGNNGIFNGHSAVINLAGESVSAMIVKPTLAQHIAFNTERGGNFPTSLMGTFAALRQMFNDAKRLADIKGLYDENPLGMKRPEADPALEALIPVVTGKMPVVIFADSEREIIRALDLTKEYGLRTIIAGGNESGKVVARIKAANVPVLLSLNFPVRTVSENKDADPESLRTLRLRVEVPKNAAILRNAGVRFAFQSGGMKNMKDYLKNAEIAVENGLSKEDALRSLTLSAAEILGVESQLGSVEKGKIANLVVFKGRLFEKDAAVTHVFVDGKMFEQPKKKDVPPPADGKKIVAGGTWNVTVEAPGVTVPITLNLTQAGDTITGSLTSTMLGSTTIRNGSVTARGFTFDATVTFQGQELELSFNGNIDGDKVEGIVTTVQGPAPFSGSRVPRN